MEITTKEAYIVFRTDEKSKFKEILKRFEELKATYKESNIIINLSDTIVNEIELELFKEISIEKANNGTSFVIVKKGMDMDKLSDNLVVVPTLQEAIDIIEFDEMTRSLDF